MPILNFWGFGLTFATKFMNFYANSGPGETVLWSGDTGTKPVTEQDGDRFKLSTTYSTPGEKTISVEVAGQANSKESLSFLIRPLPPPPPPPKFLTSFGRQEPFPDITFVSTHPASADPRADDEFLKWAYIYHDKWGLSPKKIGSIEEILERIGRLPVPIFRVRVVGHAVAGQLHIRLFRTGRIGVRDEDLDAWASSHGLGLSRTLGRLSDPSDWSVAFERLKSQNASVLQPFRFTQEGNPRDQLIKILTQRSTDLLLFRASAPAQHLSVPGDRGDVERTLVLTLREVASEIATAGLATERQARALSDAILELKTTGMNGGTPPGLPTDYLDQLRAATAAVGRKWSDKLQKARQNLRAPGFVDFRGCNLGNSVAFLSSAKNFFSMDPNALVTISAPKPLMAYLEADSKIVYIEDADFKELAKDADVSRALAHWAEIVDVKQEYPDWERNTDEGQFWEYLKWAKVLPVVRVLRDAPAGANDLDVTYYVDLNTVYNKGIPPKTKRKLSPADAELWLANHWSRTGLPAIPKLVRAWTRGTPPPAVVMRLDVPSDDYAVLPDPEYFRRIAEL